jgi:hypothetical protein
MKSKIFLFIQINILPFSIIVLIGCQYICVVRESGLPRSRLPDDYPAFMRSRFPGSRRFILGPEYMHPQ